MIREQDLLDAISECQGERNPNANTCIKLAAYYTILNQMTGVDTNNNFGYSNSKGQTVNYDTGSEFSKSVYGKDVDAVMEIMDELMDVVHALAPRIYNATIDKIRGSF